MISCKKCKWHKNDEVCTALSVDIFTPNDFFCAYFESTNNCTGKKIISKDKKMKEFSDYCKEYHELIKDFDPYKEPNEENPTFILLNHTKEEIVKLCKEHIQKQWLGMRCEISQLQKYIKENKWK